MKLKLRGTNPRWNNVIWWFGESINYTLQWCHDLLFGKHIREHVGSKFEDLINNLKKSFMEAMCDLR